MDTWLSLVGRVEYAIASAIAELAKVCSKHPYKTLGVYVAICLLCAIGIVNVEIESRAFKLWVDQDSIPINDLELVEEFFGAQSRLNRIIVTRKEGSPDANVFTKGVMDEVFVLHDAILALQTAAGNSFDDLCEQTVLGCQIGGVVKFWNGNSTIYASSVFDDEDVAATAILTTYATGEPVLRELDFANFRLNSTQDGGISDGFLLYYYLVGEFENSEFELLAWEEKVVELVTDGGLGFTETDVFVETAGSLDAELERSVGADFLLVAISYSSMSIFASLTLGRPGSKLNGRALVAMADVVVILFAGIAGYGLNMAFGIPFTSLVQVLPFILVAIGIDDAYVVAGAFDRTDPTLPVEDRMYKALFNSGMSITVTTMTTVVAFLLGSLTKLPSVTWFCYYAALAILFIYAAHLTAFVALLTLDQRRVDGGRADCVVCVHVARVEDVEEGKMKKKAMLESTPTEQQDFSMVGKFLYNTYGPFILHPFVRPIIILVFLGLTGTGIFLATMITTDFDIRDLTPDESYLRDYLTVQNDLFGSVNGRIPASLYFQDVDFSNEQQHREALRLINETLNAEYVDGELGSIDWLTTLSFWASFVPPFNNSVVDGILLGPAFYSALQVFLAQPEFKRFEDDIVFDGASTTNILISRITVFLEPLPDAVANVEALLETQEITKGSTLAVEPFIVGEAFPFFDQNRIIVQEITTSLSLCIVSVLIICSIVLVHPVSVLIMAVILAMIFTNLLGSLIVWNLDLNSISAINLIMAIGIVVDQCAHILHNFGLQDPRLPRRERVLLALSNIGPAVLLGLITTTIGIAPLGATQSEIFRTFFRSFISIVIVGGSHGLILLPVVLSFVGPSIPRDERHAKIIQT